MKLGVCAGYEQAELIKRCGFDYFEYNLVSVYNLSNEEMREAEEICDKVGIYSEVMGIMLPTHMKVVGHKIDMPMINNYLNKALDRAERLGCRKITFGSSHSRNMPRDFADRTLAYSQIVSFLSIVAEMLDKRNMSLVIEPCPIHENNILTMISEAYYVMRNVNKPNVSIMADTYSMQFGYERLDVIAAYKDAVKHLHFSAPNRTIPCQWDGYNYHDFFTLLKKIDYDETLSIEAMLYSDFSERIEGAYRLLKNGLN